jgi:hypothetical protein
LYLIDGRKFQFVNQLAGMMIACKQEIAYGDFYSFPLARIQYGVKEGKQAIPGDM